MCVVYVVELNEERTMNWQLSKRPSCSQNCVCVKEWMPVHATTGTSVRVYEHQWFSGEDIVAIDVTSIRLYEQSLVINVFTHGCLRRAYQTHDCGHGHANANTHLHN